MAKTASGLTRAAWRRCSGVNSRTGRVKKGWKTRKTGCPTRATGGKSRRRRRRR